MYRNLHNRRPNLHRLRRTCSRSLSATSAGGSGKDGDHGERQKKDDRHINFQRTLSLAQHHEWRMPLITTRRGLEVIQAPIYNKGTAFSPSERERLGVRGLLPPKVQSMEKQIKKIERALTKMDNPMQKALELQNLQDRNTTLFYRVLLDNIESLAPIVYTPTVGEVCKQFGDQFRRSRGMYFSSQDRGEMSSMVWNWPYDDVEVIVVTDGSRILGLGDLGCNGMGIPIGKLSLYCAAGGIHPRRVLPIMLDHGTNNPDLIDAEYYLGLKQPRLEGDEFFEFLDEFMNAVKLRWPKAMVQFEDFSSDKASDMLTRYRDEYMCFNDDIQGTGSVTLAGILAALRSRAVQEGKSLDMTDSLADQRIVIAGGGSAGLGVASALAHGICMENPEMTLEDALSRFWIVDHNGLFTHPACKDGSLTFEQQDFARRADEEEYQERYSLLETVKRVKPTILIGATGCSGLFSEDVVRSMKAHCDVPIIFPLSNPTALAECTAEQAFEWTDGLAVVASGSPFAPVEYNGQTKHCSQCNNMFIFPGLGLGASLAQTTTISDKMFYECAKSLASFVGPEDLKAGKIFPNVTKIRDVSLIVAKAVIKCSLEDDTSRLEREEETFSAMQSEDELEHWIFSRMFYPVYDVIVNDFQEP
eukprot:g3747.t1